MEVARGQHLGRPAAKRLHLVDQFGDPVDLIGDQAGQSQFRACQLAAEQLRRTPDSGERVLDLMRQDFRHTRQGIIAAAGGFSHGFAAADVVNREDLPTGLVDHRGNRRIHAAPALSRDKYAGCTRGNLCFAVQQPVSQARLIEVQHFRKGPPRKAAQALAQELFGSWIGCRNLLVRSEKYHRQRDTGQLTLRVRRWHHAASRRRNGA